MTKQASPSSSAELWIEEIAWRDPLAVFASIEHEPGCILLDSARHTDARSHWSILAGFPKRTLVLRSGQVFLDRKRVEAGFMSALRTLAQNLGRPDCGAAPPGLPLPGLMGFLGYEAGREFDRMPLGKMADLRLPDAFVGAYDAIAAFDVRARRAWLVGMATTRQDAEVAALRLADALLASEPEATTQGPSLPAATGRWLPDDHARAYPRMVQSAIEEIRAGEIFQANVTWRFLAERPAGLGAYALYRRLRSLSPAPFAAFLRLAPEQAILSSSPERFLKVEPDGSVESRPIKGTIARSEHPVVDRLLASALADSRKDRAENLMIVDLMRNDLGRSCAIGSVSVPVLFGVESFPAIHHLVSVVRGRLRPECDLVDLLAGSFPGGSITGAPKVRAMEIIHELEPVRRGPYCGSIFRLSADGSFDSSILIRTMMVSGDKVAAHAGGGIVADSDPAAELAEMRLKARAMLMAFEGAGRS